MKLLAAALALFLLGTFAATPAPLAALSRSDAAEPTGILAPDFELPAVQLRIVLGRALGEHAFLVMEAMRTSAEGGDEFDAAAEALDENTSAIAGVMAGVLSEAEASAFAEQWRNHVAYLLDYARAVADGDEGAARLAEDQLATYAEAFSSLLMDAFPSLPSHVVEGLVGEHVSQLEQVTDLAEGDYESVYAAIRETYAHMFVIGDALTVGIMQRGDNALDGRETALSPAVDMRMTLDRLLGEHTYLAGIVMRAHVNEDPRRDSAVAALEGNSRDLATQIARIYGDQAGAAFEDLWTRHTALYIDYVVATAAHDADEQEVSLEGLGVYRSDFSAFLADANPEIDAASLERLLETHTRHLVDQAGAYADGDFADAYAILRQAYAHTEELSAGLAGAIADQFPWLFPDTAMSASAAMPRGGTGLVVAGFVLLAMAIAGRRNGRPASDMGAHGR